MEYMKLYECAKFSDKRTKDINIESYISTENMLPYKGGVTIADTLPDCQSALKYEPYDILLSNIRPYFQKIWYADRIGSCSNDVLVLKSNGKVNSKFLYYVLSDKTFFDYDTLTSKGTKMPRGTKNAIMKYIVPNLALPIQRKIASILSSYDSLIENNTKRIRLLEQMAENLYKEWFVRFRFPGYENTEFVNGLPKCWSVKKYGEIAEIVAGGDCPCICSDIPTDDLCVPIYSNGVTNEGLYGYTNKERISKPCITISARGTIGYVCLRTIPFVPIVRLLAVVPKNISVYYLFHYSRHNYLEGNGTSQQQLTKPMLQKRKVLVPAESTLLKFDMNVENIYNQKRKLEKINNTLTRQRDLLLPRLMSGKLEVKA